MINLFVRYTVIYAVLLLFQVLLFNNIQFSGYINPYVYILFILLLPVEVPGWLLLFISFAAGYIVDLFLNTPGMHAGATVAAGFFRPLILRSISPRDGYEPGTEPSMAAYGFRWFTIYSLLVISVHHLFLFYLEVFSLAGFFKTFIKVILSTLFTAIFVLIAEYLRKGR